MVESHTRGGNRLGEWFSVPGSNDHAQTSKLTRGASGSGPLPPALDCWYLTGATAAGKTGVGLEMARLLGAEIISLDSMAVYRGMDIGTAKPTAEQLRAVPHHLIDILDPNEEFSVSDYAAAAHRLIGKIRRSGRAVLFVGGTPMYLKAMLRGIYQGPAADWEFRREVEAEARRVGIEALHQRLRQVDPLAAAKLHPNDVRRIIRALEVYKLTGEPLSHHQLQFEEGAAAERCRVFVLAWPRLTLYHRIDARVERMFHEGLVDEVRGLQARYGPLGRTASQAVGYREVQDYLRGEATLEQAVARVRSRTHQFARRQETWFRGLSECRRWELSGDTSEAETARRLVELGRRVAS
jgi:tRNA dimethylallyltransferase